MDDDAPDEGSDPRKDIDQQAGKGPDREQHMTPHPQNKWGDDGKDEQAKELEDAHEHADPSKGDKPADGGERVSTGDGRANHGRPNITDADEGHGVATEDKKL